MQMKKLLNIVSESKQINEGCGDMQSMPSPIPSVPPVTMNVSMNAQGIDQIKELIKLVSVAQTAPAVLQDPMSMAPSAIKMQPLSLMPLEPEEGPDMDDLGQELGMDLDAVKSDIKPMAPKTSSQKSPLGKMADDIRTMTDELAQESDPRYQASTTPDPTYAGMDAVDPKGDDLHKEKGTYPKVNGGDNPMAMRENSIRQALDQRYKEIKEGAKWRDPKHKDKLYTQEPRSDEDDYYGDDDYYNPKPDDYPGAKNLKGGGEFDHNDPLKKGYGRYGSGSPVEKGPRKGLPSRNHITSLKGSIKTAHGKHPRPNLPK